MPNQNQSIETIYKSENSKK